MSNHNLSTEPGQLHACAIQPYLRTLRLQVLRNRIFAKDEIVKTQLNRFTDISTVMQAMLSDSAPKTLDLTAGFRFLSPESAPLSWWLDLAGEQEEGSSGWRWVQMYNSKMAGNISRKEAVEWGDILRCALEGYLDSLSPRLGTAISSVMSAIPDRDFPFFADTPMAPLWIETAVNQLGIPHHVNVDRHQRYTYRARTRTMCLDVFVFDRCRPFYNWLPLPELYGDDLTRFNRQMVARLCLDAIGKQMHQVLPYSLRYANVVPKYGTVSQEFRFAKLRRRRVI